MTSSLTLADLTTAAVLEAACAWLCQRCRDWPPAADVWRFRRHWQTEKLQLRAELLTGTYQRLSENISCHNSQYIR